MRAVNRLQQSIIAASIFLILVSCAEDDRSGSSLRLDLQKPDGKSTKIESPKRILIGTWSLEDAVFLSSFEIISISLNPSGKYFYDEYGTISTGDEWTMELLNSGDTKSFILTFDDFNEQVTLSDDGNWMSYGDVTLQRISKWDGDMVDGLANGIWKEQRLLWRNKNVEKSYTYQEGKYAKGRRQGKWKRFFRDGKLKDTVEFKDGEEIRD